MLFTISITKFEKKKINLIVHYFLLTNTFLMNFIRINILQIC